jgi:hypothetical protein
MANPSASAILDGIASSRAAFDNNEAGSRESLIDHGRALIAALEIPSEFIQRTFWAEVSSHWTFLEPTPARILTRIDESRLNLPLSASPSTSNYFNICRTRVMRA